MHPPGGGPLPKRGPILMFDHIHILPIVQTSPTDSLVVRLKAEGMNQMEPSAATEEDLSTLSESALCARGYLRLPTSLDAALTRLEGDETVRSWFRDPFIEVYLKHKRGELEFLDGKSPEEICQAYEAVY